MSTNRLKLYNKALTLCGARTLSALTDNTEGRRILDTIWDSGAVEHCLEQGYWNFAMRTIRLDATTDIEPDFGLRYAFNKPDDWIRTYAMCSDEYFNTPITQYADEANYWFSELDVIYVQYVSNDTGYGYNYGAWPESFTRYVELYLANGIAPRLTLSDQKTQDLERKMRRALMDGRTQDCSNEGTKFNPVGRWVAARTMGWSSSRYRDGRLL